jgi:hypothetical protein
LHCTSNECKTHCCTEKPSDAANPCEFCANVDGSCYTPLALSADWNSTTDLTAGWQLPGQIFNKDEEYAMYGIYVFNRTLTIEDVIGSHACSARSEQACAHCHSSGVSKFLPVHTVNRV